MWSQHYYGEHIVLLFQTYGKHNMSTRKRAKQSNLLTNENSINVVESIGNNMSATRIRHAKARKDTATDNSMHNTARLLGKISQGATHNNDTSTDQEAIGNVKRKGNVAWKQIDSSDDDNNNISNEKSDGERERKIDNSDNVSNSSFSNGSYDERNSVSNKSKQSNDRESIRRTTDKPFYEDVQEHWRSDTVAFDMQLIKGVLPDLFAVLKFLESDDDLVFNGIIHHYFFKKLQITESKQHEWWKRNSRTVRKSIDGRHASVSNLIKRAFMGMYTLLLL